MSNWSGTARRLLLAFGALIAAYAVASAFAISGLAKVQAGLSETARRTQGVRDALQLASAVRDQYAHQAHTIILGDASHLGFYREARERVLDLARRTKSHAVEWDEQAWVDEIAQASTELDRVFTQRIVPAVLAHESHEVQIEHARALEIVSRIEERTGRLVGRFESDIERQRATVSAVEQSAWRWTLAFLLGAPFLAAAVGLYIGRSVARPIAKLKAGAARLAEGHLDTRIDIGSKDEFGALAQQFNTMTVALAEHERKLVQSEKLAGIGRLAAGVAHEINNPLGVILGYTRLLGKRAVGTDAQDLAVIEQETLRCQQIVEGLLDLSRPLKLPAQNVELGEMCQEVAARLVESKQLEGVRIRVDGSGRTSGHAEKLRQVLLNLLKNAAEAAGADGEVIVQVTSTAAGVEITVDDTGAGIDPASAAQLFEPFVTTKPHGTGLGLAVSRAIARAHGGDILAGAAPTGGARFTLLLPHRSAQGA